MASEQFMDSDVKYIQSVVPTAGSAKAISVNWEIPPEFIHNVFNFRVYFQQVAKTYIQYSDYLPSSTREHVIRDLEMDTYYRVCLIIYRNDTIKPIRECLDTSTANWQFPVSVGSSIGAVLALSIIVLLVLIARCPSANRKNKKSISDSAKYDSMSSHVQVDNYELSDTTMYNQDDEVFSEGDVSVVEPDQSSTMINSHSNDKGSNGNHNFIKPHTHVLHVHATRTSSNPLRVPHMNNNHTPAPVNPRHTVVKLDHTQCSRQHTL